jgi:hypothetical protein
MNKTYQKLNEQGPPPVNPAAKKSVLDRIKTVYPSAKKDQISGFTGTDVATVVFGDGTVKFFIDPKSKTQRYFEYDTNNKFVKKGFWEIVDNKITYSDKPFQTVLEIIKKVHPSAIASDVSGVDGAKVYFRDKYVNFIIDPKTKTQRFFEHTLDGKIVKRGEWEIVDGKIKYVESGTQVSLEPTTEPTPEPVKEPTPKPESKKTTVPEKKTSQYKRCENAPLQTKYCVSELIKKVQICLKDAGHNLGTSGPQRDGVDGYWGDLTDAALKTYGFGSGIDKQAVEVICSTVDRIKRERVAKQLKDKADQEYQQKYGGMERAAEVDYLYFGGGNAGGGDEEASGEGMEGETLFFN